MDATRCSGVLYVGAEAGHALRARHADLVERDVLWCSGDFHAGDAVHVVMRGHDGGQGAIARGVVRCDESAVASIRGRTGVPIDRANAGDGAAVVIPAAEVQLLWNALR